MRNDIDYYRLLNVLSLDVAVGSIISAAFLAKIFDTPISLYALLCLGLTVWLIYTADHLLDAKSLAVKASSLRHEFHQKHFRIISMTALFITGIIICLLFYIEQPLLLGGIYLSVFVIFYFLIQRKFGILKEWLGTILYGSGVMLPVLSYSENPFQVLLTLPSILFFNTVLINILMFSLFDREKDLADKYLSFVTMVGKRAAANLLNSLLLIQVGLLVYGYSMSSGSTNVFMMMFFALLIIYIKAKWFKVEDRYRLAGDAVFFIPIISLIQ